MLEFAHKYHVLQVHKERTSVLDSPTLGISLLLGLSYILGLLGK